MVAATTVAIAVQHWILQLWREKTHMTWFFLFSSSWKTWWRHASTSTLWTIFLRRQMTFLKPLQTYTHESESRILTDSHVSSLRLFLGLFTNWFCSFLPFLKEKLFLFSWQYVILWILGKGNAQWHCMKLNFGSEQRTHQFVVWQHAISVDRKVKCAFCRRRPSSFSLEHHTRGKWPPTGSKQLRSTRQTKNWFIKRLHQSPNIMEQKLQTKKSTKRRGGELGTKMSLKLKKQRRMKK